MNSPYTGIKYFPNKYFDHNKKKWILRPSKINHDNARNNKTTQNL